MLALRLAGYCRFQLPAAFAFLSVLHLAHTLQWASPHSTARTLADSGPPEVKANITSERPGWLRALTHADMEPLYRDNLLPDIARHASRIRRPSAISFVKTLQRLEEVELLRQSTAVLLIRGGRVAALTFPDIARVLKSRVAATQKELQLHLDSHFLSIPDTIFILNNRNSPACTMGRCLVPIFSHVNEYIEGSILKCEDILVPHLCHPYEQLVDYPWELKVPTAVMRAGIHKDMVRGTCRFVMLQLASHKRLLDIGVTSIGNKWVPEDAEEKAQLPPSELAKWRYLISCDGVRASPRLAQLLHINSPVLKGRSIWAEWYYRSLKAGEHYVDLDPDDVLEVVKASNAASEEGRMQEIAEAGQRFAYRYLSQRSRALYYERAVQLYNELFGEDGMASLLRQLPTDREVVLSDVMNMTL